MQPRDRRAGFVAVSNEAACILCSFVGKATLAGVAL